MVFSSILFLFVYLVAVIGIYYLLPRKVKNPWLFVTSLLFYGYGEPVLLLLMIASIAVNYFSGYLIERWADRPKAKKAALIVCVAANQRSRWY